MVKFLALVGALLCGAFDCWYVFTAWNLVMDVSKGIQTASWLSVLANGFILAILLWVGLAFAILAGIGVIVLGAMAFGD